ncbi:MAG: XrtA/PEP-CTERM system TPR-repeat protein PrsT [Burkholderiaceae bacterium]
MRPTLQIGCFALALLLGACSGTGDPEALLAKAQTAITKEDLKAAEIHLKNLLQSRPEHAEGRAMLARLHVLARDERSAAKEWQRAIDAGADPEQLVPELLSSLYGSANYTEVHAAAERHPVKTESARAAVLYWTGQALWQERKTEEARKRFNEALAVRRDHAPSRLALIRMQMPQDPQGARQALDQLIEQVPGMADALLLRAEYAISEREFDQAQDLLRKAITSEPRHLQARVRLITLLTERKDVKVAESEYQQLVQVAKNAVLTRMVRVLIDYRKGELQKAAEGIDVVLKGAADYPPALILGAQIALARGELEKADQMARRVSELTQGAVAGLRLQAAVALARNEPDKALQIARSRIDRGQEDAGLLAIAGEASLRRNDLPTAVDLLNRATKAEPDDAGMRTALGVASLAAGNTRGGFNELERAVELDVDSSRSDLILIGQRLQRGEWDAALAAIERLEQKQPGKALNLNLMGAAQLAKGETVEARKSFEKALQREPAFFPAVANLVRMDLNDARSDDARKRLEAFVKANPKEVNGLLSLAQLQRAQGAKAEDITRLLRQAHEAAPTQLEAVVSLTQQLVSQDKVTEALPIVQKAVAQNPEDVRLLDLLGSLYLRNKDHQQALETYSKITRIKPDLAAAHLRLGEVRSTIGDQSGAMASFRRAAELDARAPAAQFGMAAALVREGRKEEALRLARKLQTEQPKSAMGLILEGDLLGAENQWKEAATVFRRSLGVERTAAGAIREHQALLKAGESAQAESALRASIAASPDNLALRTYAGDLAIRNRQWKVAIEHFEPVVKRNPGNPDARNSLAWAMHMSQDARAEEHARVAFQIAPLSGPIADTLGVVLLSKGQKEQALGILRQAVMLSPKDADIRLSLLQALEQNDRKEEVRKQAEQWLRDFPGSPRSDEVKALQSRVASR